MNNFMLVITKHEILELLYRSSYFLMYKSTPIFQAKNNNIFESMYKSTPMIDDTTQNKIGGIKDKKQ